MKRAIEQFLTTAAVIVCSAVCLAACNSRSPTDPLSSTEVEGSEWDVVITASHQHEGVMVVLQSADSIEVTGWLVWSEIGDSFFDTFGNNDLSGVIENSRFDFTIESDCTLIEDGQGSVSISPDGQRMVGTLISEVHCEHTGEPEEWEFEATRV